MFRLENDKASKLVLDDSDFLAVRFISDSLICAIYEDSIHITKIQVKKKEFLFIASPKISVKLSPKTNHLIAESKYHTFAHAFFNDYWVFKTSATFFSIRTGWKLKPLLESVYVIRLSVILQYLDLLLKSFFLFYKIKPFKKTTTTPYSIPNSHYKILKLEIIYIKFSLLHILVLFCREFWSYFADSS